MVIRFTTAGESHGPGLTAVVEGLPAGLDLTPEDIDRDLARRQLGHGRGGRMKIESDRADGDRGRASRPYARQPGGARIENRDYRNWEERMNPWPVEAEVEEVHLPRPGHADLAGVQKYGFTDVRNVLERASARETAARVAAGALAKVLLRAFGVAGAEPRACRSGRYARLSPMGWSPATSPAWTSRRCAAWTRRPARRWSAEINAARKANESLGGVYEVRAFGVVAGIGSYVSWDSAWTAAWPRRSCPSRP